MTPTELPGRVRSWLPALGLLLLLALIFAPVWTRGHIPLNGDWLVGNFEPYRSEQPGLEPHNRQIEDPVLSFYPRAAQAAASWRGGELPLWDRAMLAGTPMVHSLLPFNPLMLGYWWFPPPVAWTLLVLGMLVLIAVGAYGYGRALRLDPLPACMLALVATCNGLVGSWLEYTALLAPFAWLFPALAAAQRYRNGDGRGWAGLLVLAVGGLVLSGNLQHILYALTWLGLVLWWMPPLPHRVTPGQPAAPAVRPGPRAVLGLAVVAGIALGAVQFLPELALLTQGGRDLGRYAGFNGLDGYSLLLAVFPQFFGTPADDLLAPFWETAPRNYVQQAILFVGGPALLLTLLAPWAARVRRIARAHLATVLGLPLLVAASPLLSRALPLIDSVDQRRCLILVPWSASILAAITLQELLAPREAAEERLLLRSRRIALSIVLTLVGGALTLPLLAEHGDPASPFISHLRLLERQGGILTWSGLTVPLLILAATTGLLWLYRGATRPGADRPDAGRAPRHTRPLGPPLFGGLLLALAALELLAWLIPLNPFSDPTRLTRPSPTVQALSGRDPDGLPFRISATTGHGMQALFGTLLPPNAPMLHGLEDARGYALTVPPLYKQLLRAADGVRGGSRVALLHQRFDSWIFDLLNIRRVASREPLRGGGLRPLLGPPASQLRVYENTTAFPRAFFAWETEQLDEAGLLATAREPRGSRPPHRLLLPPGVDAPSLPGPVTGTLRWLAGSATRITLDVAVDRPAYLVLLESRAPGWQATVDGVATEILPAFHLFRAVRVGPGRHQVEFRYRPATLTWGLVVSGTTLLVGLLTLGGALLRRRTPGRQGVRA